MKQQYRALKARVVGLTLIEILVGLAVLGVVLAVAVPSMSDLLEKRRVSAAAEEVASILTYAKAETVAANELLFVKFGEPTLSSMSCAMVVTSGSSNSCRCSNAVNNLCPNTSSRSLRLFQLPKNHVKFDAFAEPWAAGANYIRFAREQMAMDSMNFSVDAVGLKKGYTLRVEVNNMGRVKICAPTAPAERNKNLEFRKMNGYGPC